MSRTNIFESIGYLFYRKDMPVSLVDLKRELINHIFEASIIKLGIESFLNRSFISLDPSIGDWKCQTRASILVDISSAHDISKFLSEELQKINKLLNNIENYLQQINSFNSVESQNFSRKELHNLSLGQILKANDLLYFSSEKALLLGLGFLTTTENENFSIFINHQLSVNKMKAIINQAKKDLCHLSIEYEKHLALEYGTKENQKALQQIEHKAMQYMTSLFVGFMPIFQKMKAKKEPFLINYLCFCHCGGVQSITSELMQFQNYDFIKIPTENYMDKVVTVIEVYQYPGSLQDLQNRLNISVELTNIPVDYYKWCTCFSPWKIDDYGYSLETKIMGFFAQHPQFTNHAEINWKGLELEDSDLKKEYEQFLKVKGVSQKDMSVFQINHMYASTVGQELEDQRQLLLKLGKK
jgi:hypothetical protein